MHIYLFKTKDDYVHNLHVHPFLSVHSSDFTFKNIYEECIHFDFFFQTIHEFKSTDGLDSPEKNTYKNFNRDFENRSETMLTLLSFHLSTWCNSTKRDFREKICSSLGSPIKQYIS